MNVRTYTLREWENVFEDEAGPAFSALARIYGSDRSCLRKKADFGIEAVRAFGREFGSNASVFLVRSTGRINLIGMHVDHRGGTVNPIAVLETWLVCEPRDDDVMNCASDRRHLFPTGTFAIQEELGEGRIENWDHWTQALAEKRKTAGTHGHWINYVKSAALYLEHERPIRNATAPPLRGMNMLVAGRVPFGAGLSSSSSIVVGTAEALVYRNGLVMSDKDLVDSCGQAEWYVGTRGGSGDHAAIKHGKLNHVSCLGSHPLTVDAARFPDHLRVLLCNSLIESRKSEGARDEFNNRIASYEFGQMLLKKACPEHAPKIEYLRDVNPEALGVTEAGICRMLLHLPERMTRDEVLAALPEHEDRIRHIFGSHTEPQNGYPVRKICAFGITECVRSRMAAAALRTGDIALFGEIINISHNGDRMTRVSGTGRRTPVDNAIPDAYIQQRISDLESGDPARMKQARLWRMPGGYGVSLPELDTIVDTALASKGVVAARVVGAGLGGAVHVIVHKDDIQAVLTNIARTYYEPRGLDPVAEVYSPVGGSGVFAIDK